MPSTALHPGLAETRLRVAARLRALRKERGWTQVELAAHLGLSQARLSEIERGGGSFTAEQLIEVLRLFNVDIAEFLPPGNADDELQNALIRYGATHLRQVPGVAATGRYSSPSEAILATLLESRSSRLVTALAPVLLTHIDSISLPGLRLWLRKEHREHRLGWLLENVRDALTHVPPDADASWKRRAARAITVLNGELEHFPADLADSPPDLFDPTIRSPRSRDRVWNHEASAISRRWGIVSDLVPDDFRTAIWSAATWSADGRR